MLQGEESFGVLNWSLFVRGIFFRMVRVFVIYF